MVSVDNQIVPYFVLLFGFKFLKMQYIKYRNRDSCLIEIDSCLMPDNKSNIFTLSRLSWNWKLSTPS